MRYAISVAIIATLSACGGTTSTDPVVENLVSTNRTVASPLLTEPVVPTAPVGGVGDISFGSLLNEVRAANGAGPVSYDGRLNQAAQAHAEDMLENDYFDHVGLNGSTVGTRVQATGYSFSRVGENIASGYRSEETVLNGWVNSPGHQRNNVDPNFEDFGLGYVRDGNDTRWVLVLGKEQ